MAVESAMMPGARGRMVAVGGIGAAMLLPVLPERISGAVAWDPGDFVFLLILLAIAAGALELAARTGARNAYRVASGLALAAGLFQAWITLAVGIIGSEDDPANLIHAAVLAIAVAGALVARGRAPGMARAMAVAAAAQALAFLVALAAGWGFTGPLSIAFVTLWLASSRLFRRAAMAA